MKFVEHFVARTAKNILYGSLLATLTLFTSSHGAYAWKQITVKFDTLGGHDIGPIHEGDRIIQGGATITDSSRGSDEVFFTSQGFPAGSIIKNGTTAIITDLHIKLINPDKNGGLCQFAPNSTGGAAFPDKPKIENNSTEITFSGGNVPVGKTFWSFIPKSSDFKDGSCSYVGRVTPTKP